jgi:arginine exporter protein ArgO
MLLNGRKTILYFFSLSLLATVLNCTAQFKKAVKYVTAFVASLYQALILQLSVQI